LKPTVCLFCVILCRTIFIIATGYLHLFSKEFPPRDLLAGLD
jgi:hypothetical protein